jgi:hypothetical protein
MPERSGILPGVDINTKETEMKTPATPDLRTKLLALEPWHRMTYSYPYPRYQSCRFCKRSVAEVGALWKYSVRHYICDACRDLILGFTAPNLEAK